MKILVIEDDKSLAATLKEFLEQEVYFVDYFYSLDDISSVISSGTLNVINVR